MASVIAIEEDQLAEIFKGYEKIVSVYLFGSQVKGNADKFSDYDFAVLFEERPKVKWDTLGDLLCRAFSVVGQDKADVVDLIDQPLWFQQEIVESGKIIYEVSEEKRLSYERELAIKCLEEGVPEYVEDGRMRKQDVKIHFDTIDENMKMLEQMRKLSYQEFISDFRNFPASIYCLQTSIEALADISRYVIRCLSLPTPEEYWQIHKTLSDAGYIQGEDAEIYVEMVRFRNRVVHFYYKATPEEIYKILTEDLSDIRNWRDTLLEIIESNL
ncbi:MAG: HepT-like ribonuclease domain-containing protein [Candidatus Poribacteria bacterium]